MNWKYLIPHEWHSPDDRMVWEDVYLMPEDGSTQGKSVWFTLDALTVGAAGLGNDFPDSPEGIREYNLQLLGDKEFFITSAPDMIAKIDNFNRKELLEWTALFIRVHFRDPNPILVEGTAEEFARSNPHAREIGRITEALANGVPEEDVIHYHSQVIDDLPSDDW